MKRTKGGVELGIGAEGGVVGGFGEGDAVGSGEGGGRFAGEIDDAEVGEAVFAFDEDEMGAEGGYAGEHDAGTVGDDFVPAGADGIDGGGGHEAEGAAGVVGADEEDAGRGIAGTAGVMVDVVFVVVAAFVDQLKLQGGAVGAEEADFAGGVAVGDEEDDRRRCGCVRRRCGSARLFLRREECRGRWSR